MGACYNEAIETAPRHRIRATQIDRLRTLIGTIVGHNPLYTDKLGGIEPGDIGDHADLERLPFTTKADLIAAQTETSSDNCTFGEEAYVRLHQTSGTTGEPLRVYDTVDSWNWWSRCWGFVLAGAGIGPRDRLFLPFSFGPFIGFWAAVGGAERVGAMMISGGGQGSPQRLGLISRMGATAMCCTPTYALRLAEVARDAGVDPRDLPIETIVTAGEPGGTVGATRALIEQTWKARVFDHAGASEVGAHSFECDQHTGGIHVIESEFIVEVIDPGGDRTVPSGARGELVITSLGRPGFPVIRYRTGDLVQLDPEPCPCGRTFVRLAGGIIGRVDDMVVVRGANIYPSAVDDLIRRHPDVTEYRVTVTRRRQMRHLRIEIECAGGADPDTTARTVTTTFTDHLALTPEVTAVPAGTLPRFELKARRFVIED